MNPGGFPNMGGGRPPQSHGGMQRNTGADIQTYILQVLQSQPVPPGWQMTVAPKQRAHTIHQMVTGLRLVKSEMQLGHAISVATGFEMQQFQKCPDLESYNKSWMRKLQEIQVTRQNQANMQQQQFQNQQAAQMGLNPQQMQARGMINGQNQFQPGLGIQQPPQSGQAMSAPMQPQLSQTQRMTPNTNMGEMQQPMQNGQQLQNVPRPVPPNRPQFTAEENQHINNMARQMLARLSEQDRMNIQRQLSSTIPAQQQAAMRAQNIDPMFAYMRSQAVRNFANDKQKRMQMSGQGHPAPVSGGVPPQGHPLSQMNMRNSQTPHIPPTTQPPPENSFGMGNMDQFVHQQTEGLRHQAAGQDVVPASHGQAGPPQMRGTPHQAPQGQFTPNRPMQGQGFPTQSQPPWNGAQTQAQNVQPNGHLPMQPPTPNFAGIQAQTPQPSLQGQPGGLTNNRGQRTPQQNHNMPTLNRAMNPPNQGKNDLSQKPSQPTPKQSQQNRPSGAPATANGKQPNSSQPSQMLASIYAKLPRDVQQSLQRMPEEQRKRWIQQKVKAVVEAQKSGNTQDANQPASGVQANGSNSSLGTNISYAKNAQAMSTANPAGPQPNINAFGRVNTQPPNGATDPSRPAPPKTVPMQLNEGQLQYMDNQPFPPQILNKNTALGQLPEAVKTWRHLKDYVQQRLQSLGPETMNTVLFLQSAHCQQIQAVAAKKQKQLQMMNQGNLPPGQTGQAPQAPPMVPPQTTQIPMPGNLPPGKFSMPQLPQPTMQEVHAARATLPENMKGIPDHQLQQMILHRRQQEFIKANQSRLSVQQQQQLQRNNLTNAQRLSGQPGQFAMGQNLPLQGQQSMKAQTQPPHSIQHSTQTQQLPPKQPTGPQGRQPQGNNDAHGPQAGQQGVKRPTNDDVVEVPDPKTQQPQPRPPNARPGQTPQTTAPQQITQMQDEQKAQIQAKIREDHRAKSVTSGRNPSSQPSMTAQNHQIGVNTAQNAQRDVDFQTLVLEVARSTPSRPPVPMSPKTRNQMIEKLKDNTASQIHRLEQSLPLIVRFGQLDRAKELLRMRMIIRQQVQDPKFEHPVENFTMTLQELDEYKSKLTQYFIEMMQNSGNSQPGQPQQLNAKNLQQQQAIFNAARAATAAQKSQTEINSRAPAAPTATHPPFPFKSQSPDGVPKIYPGNNGLTRDQLKLPPGKRRKHNQSAASTPANTIPTPAAKIESPEAPRAPVVPNMIKCPVSDCESGKTGFATKEDLEKHRSEVHEPKEPAIKDPLDAAAYAIESLRIALNLDENGKSEPTAPPNESAKEDKSILQAPAMNASASSQSTSVKQEVATPMSRNPTQTGPSPSSSFLKTPRAAGIVKTPASDVASAGKDTGVKKPVSKVPAATAPDLWASSHVRPEWFKEVFSDVAHLNRPVSDNFITSWLERNPFTPPTSPSSGAAIDKESPHKSDISANDNLNINLAAEGEDWSPYEWFDDGLRGDMEALDVGELMDMSWDTSLSGNNNEDETLGKGKRRREPHEPSDEWLKAWAPDKYEERLKKEAAQRKR